MGGDSWWYEVGSVEISSAATMTKTIEYLQTEQITPEGMTGERTEDRVEAAAVPTSSPRRRAKRSG